MRRQSEMQVNADNTMPDYSTEKTDDPAPAESDSGSDSSSDE